jgi:hypothetical protein
MLFVLYEQKKNHKKTCAVAAAQICKPAMFMQVMGTHGYGFQAGSQLETRTHTRENPTRVPARYHVPAVLH